jgi:threonine/homoserine/homoserine lactone efflux protein
LGVKRSVNSDTAFPVSYAAKGMARALLSTVRHGATRGVRASLQARMGLVVDVVAWVLAIAIFAALVAVFFVAIREPIRIWKREQRRRAVLTAIAVAMGLFVWIALSRVVP